MRGRSLGALGLCLAAGALVVVSPTHASPEPPAPAGGARPKKGAYEVVAVTDGGTIRVTCKVTKAVPATEIPLNKDQAGCGHTSMPSERAIVDAETLGLANCVVYLEEIAKGKDFAGEMASKNRVVVLDQKSCRYVPHVQLVRTGSKVSVKNSDTVQHNVKAFHNNKGNLKFNIMSSSESTLPPTEDTTLSKAGSYILLCDIHFWMTGYIRAVAHPYHALTDAKGVAELTEVPPGTYKLRCWHEGMVMTPEMVGAEIQNYRTSADFDLPPRDVTVTAGQTAEVVFEVEPR